MQCSTSWGYDHSVPHDTFVLTGPESLCGDSVIDTKVPTGS